MIDGATSSSPAQNPAMAAAPITSVQPGGGTCMSIELAWGRWRRWQLRTFRPGYVRRMSEKRQGECANCPHDIVDPRDLKFYRNVCGYWFRPEDDRFQWRDRMGFARVGLGELVLFGSGCLLLIAGCLIAWTAGWPDWVVWPIAVAATLFLLETLYFFRDPERLIPGDPNVVVSPADGTVTDVGEVEAPDFPGGRAFRIGIFLSVFNVHVNRMPRTAQVTALQYFPGKFFDARREECATQNEQLWIDAIDTATQRPMRVKQISGMLARRIVCWLKVGDTPKIGERLGMIKFGSRTELYLPADMPVQAAVKVGDKVQGGATALLRFADNGK
jgi:phosphatidylserine decarboxylase